MAAQPTLEEIKRREREFRLKAIANFPFERVEVAGDQALGTWEKLRTAGRGVPIVLGDDESFARIAEQLHHSVTTRRSVAETLEIARRLRHPDDLIAMREAESSALQARLKEFLENQSKMHMPAMPDAQMHGDGRIAEILQDSIVLEVPEPTTTSSHFPGLLVAFDLRTGSPLEKVHIALIPTDDPTTVPAYLRWGGWNACPTDEYHVAALRSWSERFGAELIGLGPDTMNLRVEMRPQSPADAMKLAREHYAYCNDIVDQGVGTLKALATELLNNDWWFFWWD